ncbi:MAG: cupin domain-containing protein [Corynebacterium sp.]|nr:cupin domain-containing protein [Corynebacterium sp.]
MSQIKAQVNDLAADFPPIDEASARPAVKRLSPGVVLFSFGPGQSLNDHKAVHPISVQVLDGAIDFGVGEEVYHLTAGSLLQLDKLVIHRVDNHGTEPAHMVLSMLCPPK